MANTYKVLSQYQATTNDAIIYTAPTAAIVSTVSIANVSTADATATVRVSSGASPSVMSINNTLTWTSQTAGGTAAVNHLVYGNNTYVLWSTTSLRTSTDAITWTTRAVNDTLYGFGYGNGEFRAVTGTNTSAQVRRTSTDAITWTTISTTTDRGGNIFWANGYFIDSNLNEDAITGLVYGAGVWVRTTVGNAIDTSPDYVTWTSRTSGFTGGQDTINGLDYGAGLFVAVGNSGKIQTSTNGTTWTTRTSGTANDLGYVKYITDPSFVSPFFVAGVASGTNVLVSTDAITWTTRNTGVSAPYAVTFSRSKILVGGTSNALATADISQDKGYLLKDAVIPANSTANLTFGLALESGTQVLASSNTNNAIAVHLFGSEIS